MVLVLLIAGCGTAEPAGAPGSPDPRDPRGERRILDSGTQGRGDWTLTAYQEDESNDVCMSISVVWRDTGDNGGVSPECVGLESIPDPGRADLLTEQPDRGNMIVGIAASDVMAVEIAYRGEETGSRTVRTIDLEPWVDGRVFATVLPRLTDVTGVSASEEP